MGEFQLPAWPRSPLFDAFQSLADEIRVRLEAMAADACRARELARLQREANRELIGRARRRVAG